MKFLAVYKLTLKRKIFIAIFAYLILSMSLMMGGSVGIFLNTPSNITMVGFDSMMHIFLFIITILMSSELNFSIQNNCNKITFLKGYVLSLLTCAFIFAFISVGFDYILNVFKIEATTINYSILKNDSILEYLEQLLFSFSINLIPVSLGLIVAGFHAKSNLYLKIVTYISGPIILIMTLNNLFSNPEYMNNLIDFIHILVNNNFILCISNILMVLVSTIIFWLFIRKLELD